jgi:molybdenum cofactor cytidylyltransferase
VSRTYGLIPAAGKSRRMGRQKLTLPWKGKNVLECAIAALIEGGVTTVVVVIGPGEIQLRTLAEKAGAEAAELTQPTAEMRETIEHGLEWIERRHRPTFDDGWLLLPADHPNIEIETVKQILAARSGNPSKSIVVPTFEDRGGHPVWISWRHVAEIRKMPAGVGLNIYLRQQAGDALLLPVNASSVLSDLDTPEDLQRLSK